MMESKTGCQCGDKLLPDQRDRELNEFIQYNLLYAIKNSVPLIKNVKIIEPEGDLVLEKDKVIICGTVTVNIEREE